MVYLCARYVDVVGRIQVFMKTFFKVCRVFSDGKIIKLPSRPDSTIDNCTIIIDRISTYQSLATPGNIIEV